MGGSAFSATLPASAFPRIPPAVYHAIKARLTPHLQTLYSIVSTPYEAPEKSDHGDLDFLVCEPLNLTGATRAEVPHEEVQTLLKATHGEWAALGHGPEEEAARRHAKETDNQEETFYQVDVHVCLDKAEWERIHFFHGYGDLGMIMGLIARNKGLHLGQNGLKVPSPPRPPLDLCDNMDAILQYMGLSMQRWNAGFQTKKEVFEWGQGIKKVKPERKMYAQFVEWVQEQQHDASGSPRGLEKEEQIQHALKYFGKKEQWDKLEREEADKARLKEGFNGTKTREWAGLPLQQWKDLKSIMDQVRSELGGEPGILKILDERGEEGVKEYVLKAKAKLGIRSEEETSEVTKELESSV
ncbi:hypothetical protein MVEN_02482000 [Mycena venus]|uniref:Uncharacterized protein n=1 Tax=Mycena venus TaxID=2733690 RepID=A0A8H7CBT2_9AGAR|nr:hypothetical protein MVEN_02482000 [Mycena venus]